MDGPDWRLVPLRIPGKWSSAVRRGLLEETRSPPVPPIRIQTMSDAYDYWNQVWSDNPHAPQIARSHYIEEKAVLAGSFVGSILYGTPIRMFDHSCRL